MPWKTVKLQLQVILYTTYSVLQLTKCFNLYHPPDSNFILNDLRSMNLQHIHLEHGKHPLSTDINRISFSLLVQRQTMQNINNKDNGMCTSRSEDDDLPSYQMNHDTTNTENFDYVGESPFGSDFSIIPDFTNILELAPACLRNHRMDSEITSRNYFPPIIERKRIYYCYHYCYPKGVLFAACLPITILLFSCLTAVFLYNVIALKTELGNLQAELRTYRKLDSQSPTLVLENNSNGARSQTHSSWAEDNQVSLWKILSKEGGVGPSNSRSRRYTSEGKVLHSCMQLIADRSRNVEDEDDDNTIIPWLPSFKQGTAFDDKQNKILIKESGLFFVYGQVWYTDTVFAMGHLIQRKKAQLVGNDPGLVTLFRCIQNMPQSDSNNSCFTAGVAKLEEGDELHLIIPRGKAKISLSGDGTFFGAIKLL
ncbi:tumor necrosis factor ligand superfamily member 13B [Pseudophryne corroboree]|uniref:tumor necrosis factor ligand superfamily member 13B n=1 Tax=Pseudophryne corroboree TaxID=495146 RepID=UPI003081AB54